jgi:hypothetical protein
MFQGSRAWSQWGLVHRFHVLLACRKFWFSNIMLHCALRSGHVAGQSWGSGTVITFDPGTHTYSVRYAADGSTERAISATALTPATATRGRGQRTTRGQGVAWLTAMTLGQTTTAPARPIFFFSTSRGLCGALGA